MTNKSPGPVSRSQLGEAISHLMPNIIRGAQLDLFAKSTITQTQFMVIVALHAAKRSKMGDLARGLHVTMPTMTGVVGRLVKSGHIKRFVNPLDRRQVTVELTAKGQSFVRQFQQVIRNRWQRVLVSLEDREVEAFHGIVTKLLKQFEHEVVR